jgi:hypothetical protein
VRYGAVRRSLGEPDPFRLRYRAPVAATITMIVRDGMDKKTTPAFIRQCAAVGIPQEDQARFVEVVETELMSRVTSPVTACGHRNTRPGGKRGADMQWRDDCGMRRCVGPCDCGGVP